MKLVSAKIASPKVGLSPRTLLDQAHRGDIPHYRFGRSVRFDLDELLAAARVEVSALPDDEGEFDAEAAYQALVA